MRYYIDITLISTDDIGHYFLWSKLYQQVHLALVEGGVGGVGVAFPEYSSAQPRLGRKLRVFSQDESTLAKLDLNRWLSRLSDYCHITSIRTVPEHSSYAMFSRKQSSINPERLAKRRSKRKGETIEKSVEYFSDYQGELIALPFISMKSLSTSTSDNTSGRFKLFVERTLLENAQDGEFTSYGLSKTATVPWF